MGWSTELYEAMILGRRLSDSEFGLIVQAVAASEAVPVIDKYSGDQSVYDRIFAASGEVVTHVLETATRHVENAGQTITSWCFLSDDQRSGARAFGDVGGDYQFSLPGVKTPRGGDEQILVYVASGTEKLLRKRQLFEAEMSMKEKTIAVGDFTKLLLAIEFFSPEIVSLMIPFEERKSLYPSKARNLKAALEILLDLQIISLEDLDDRELVLAKLTGIIKAIKGEFRSLDSNKISGMDAILQKLRSAKQQG